MYFLSQSNAVFTLGQNMFSLITNKTCFTRNLFTSGGACANHDRHMFILSMVETTSRGSLDLSQTKHSANVVSLSNIPLLFILEELEKCRRLNYKTCNSKFEICFFFQFMCNYIKDFMRAYACFIKQHKL